MLIFLLFIGLLSVLAHSLKPDGFHLATLEMIGIQNSKNMPGITSKQLEEFIETFSLILN
uniref:Uncharacterized protein n=1 Tax=Meloidogyne hapla TaxID=6305 RepID=A0A1I8B5R9_MELHA